MCLCFQVVFLERIRILPQGVKPGDGLLLICKPRIDMALQEGYFVEQVTVVGFFLRRHTPRVAPID